MNIPKGDISEIIKAAGISENARPEQLSMENFAELSNRLAVSQI